MGAQRGAVLAHGVLQGTRGQQGRTAATAAGCSGGLGASLWGSAGGGTPDPVQGEHPGPNSVLLLEPSLHVVDTGDAQSQLSRISPHFLGPSTFVQGWIRQRLPMHWGRAELLPASAHGAAGVHRRRAPTLGRSVSLQRCLGGDQAWHVRGVVVPARGMFWQEGVPVPRVRAVTCRCF